MTKSFSIMMGYASGGLSDESRINHSNEIKVNAQH